MTVRHPVQTRGGRARRGRATLGAVVAVAVLTVLLGSCSQAQSGQAVPVGTPVVGSNGPTYGSGTPTRPEASSDGPVDSVVVSPAPGSSVSTGEAPPVSTVTVTASTTPASSGRSTISRTTAPTGTSKPTTSKPAAPRPTVAPIGPNADPAPKCWTSGACPALTTADLGDGWKVVAVNPDQTHSVMILLSAGRAFDQLVMRDLGDHPGLNCPDVAGAPTCLLSGVPGAHTAFGSVARVSGGRLQNLTAKLVDAQMFAEGGFSIRRIDAGSLLISGLVAFYDYGSSYAASPKAWSTYLVSGRAVTQTGCDAPAFDPPAAPTAPRTGVCTGTPQIAGYGPGSATKIVDLDDGIVSRSGNLWCVHQNYGNGHVACRINATDFAVSRNCSGQPGTIVGWSDGGKAEISGCQGDTMVTAGRHPIAYGQLAVSGDIRCVISESGGVRCQNSSDHGFVLSRAAFTTF